MDRARFQQDRWHARSVKQRLRGVRCDLRGCWPVPVSALFFIPSSHFVLKENGANGGEGLGQKRTRDFEP
jgi:hypothetical protein